MLTDLGIIFHLPCLACNLSEDSLPQRDVIFLLGLTELCLIHSCLLFQELLRCAISKPCFAAVPRANQRLGVHTAYALLLAALLACQSLKNLPLYRDVASIRIIQRSRNSG
jgi:hypothetical protein